MTTTATLQQSLREVLRLLASGFEVEAVSTRLAISAATASDLLRRRVGCA